MNRAIERELRQQLERLAPEQQRQVLDFARALPAHWPGAETLAREALPLSENLRRQELIAANCHRLAKALVRQGKPPEALPHTQRAVEIYTGLGSPSL